MIKEKEDMEENNKEYLLQQMTHNFHDTLKKLNKAEARIKELEEEKAAAVKALYPEKQEKKENLDICHQNKFKEKIDPLAQFLIKERGEYNVYEVPIRIMKNINPDDLNRYHEILRTGEDIPNQVIIIEARLK